MKTLHLLGRWLAATFGFGIAAALVAAGALWLLNPYVWFGRLDHWLDLSSFALRVALWAAFSLAAAAFGAIIGLGHWALLRPWYHSAVRTASVGAAFGPICAFTSVVVAADQPGVLNWYTVGAATCLSVSLSLGAFSLVTARVADAGSNYRLQRSARNRDD